MWLRFHGRGCGYRTLFCYLQAFICQTPSFFFHLVSIFIFRFIAQFKDIWLHGFKLIQTIFFFILENINLGGHFLLKTFLSTDNFWTTLLLKSCPIFVELTFIDRFFKIYSFEYVDSWPKFLLLRTHLHWNSTTKLILNCILITFKHIYIHIDLKAQSKHIFKSHFWRSMIRSEFLEQLALVYYLFTSRISLN